MEHEMKVDLDGVKDNVSVIRLSSEGVKEDEALSTTPFRCPYRSCAFKTLYSLSFARHLESSHKDYGIFAYRCNGCKGNFLTSFALGRHQLRKCKPSENVPAKNASITPGPTKLTSENPRTASQHRKQPTPGRQRQKKKVHRGRGRTRKHCLICSKCQGTFPTLMVLGRHERQCAKRAAAAAIPVNILREDPTCTDREQSNPVPQSQNVPAQESVIIPGPTTTTAKNPDFSAIPDPKLPASKPDSYGCSYCSYRSKWRRCVKTHERSLCSFRPKDQHVMATPAKEAVGSTPEFRCPYPDCVWKTRCKYAIPGHLNVHKTKPNFAFTCSGCKGKLPTSIALSKHQRQCSVLEAARKPRNAHLVPSANQLADGKFGCPRCDYVSNRAVRMRSHLLSHEASNETMSEGPNVTPAGMSWHVSASPTDENMVPVVQVKLENLDLENPLQTSEVPESQNVPAKDVSIIPGPAKLTSENPSNAPAGMKEPSADRQSKKKKYRRGPGRPRKQLGVGETLGWWSERPLEFPDVTGYKRVEKVQCPHCGKQLSAFLLHSHIVSHMKPNPYGCSYCSFRSELKSDVLTHEREWCRSKGQQVVAQPENIISESPASSSAGKESVVSSSEFRCPYPDCVYKTRSKYTVPHHLKLHLRNRTLPYTCSICKGKFSSFTALIIHQRKCSGIGPVSTTTIGMRSGLLSHDASNETVEDPKVTSGKMKQHVPAQESVTIPVVRKGRGRKSSKPPLEFPDVTSYKGHENVQCPHCGQQCPAYHLHKHILIHTKPNRYGWSHCSYRSKWYLNVKMHERKWCRYKPKGTHVTAASAHLIPESPASGSANKEDVASSSEFRCPYPDCVWKTRWKYAIPGHLKVHKKNLNLAYTCSGCKGTLPTSIALTIHQRQCSLLGAARKPRNTILIPSAYQLADGKFGCPRCDYVSKTAVRMRSHLISHETYKEPREDPKVTSGEMSWPVTATSSDENLVPVQVKLEELDSENPLQMSELPQGPNATATDPNVIPHPAKLVFENPSSISIQELETGAPEEAINFAPADAPVVPEEDQPATPAQSSSAIPPASTFACMLCSFVGTTLESAVAHAATHNNMNAASQ